jgi:hypothetical protein
MTHTADYDAVRRRLDGHEWRGGYYCECGRLLNSPSGYLAHLATVLTRVTPPGECANGMTRHYFSIDGTCQRCGHDSRVIPPAKS